MIGHNLFAYLLPIFLDPNQPVARASEKSDIPERISAIYFDHGKVARLYLYPGRTTLLDFPCEVTKAVPGPASDIETVLGATDKSELDVWLKSGASQPTNLTVRCSKDVFVFDVIPSRATHQDYVQIVGSFGGPELTLEPARSERADVDPYQGKKLVSSSQNSEPVKKLLQSSQKKPRTSPPGGGK